MTSGGWHSQEHSHGRHRQGATGAAWTPAVRPTDAGPAHARGDRFVPAARPTDGPGWPVSEVLTRRPRWPDESMDQMVPAARRASEVGRPWPAQLGRQPAHATPAWPAGEPAPARPVNEPVWPGEDAGPRPEERPEVRVALRRARHAAPPKRKTVSADMVLDTVPMGRVRDKAVVYALPETTATGLRKFDLGNVPASVTPPRSWRRAAWFAVGTSAAVVLGLTVAAVELIGRPVNDSGLIDALPAYPTGPLTLEKLPNQQSGPTGSPSAKPTSSRPQTSSVQQQPQPSVPQTHDGPPRDTVTGSTTHGGGTPGSPSPTSHSTTQTAPKDPPRRTVGPAPVAPTDPQAMGDRTEEYFKLVTTDPSGAHAMTTGGMAREGREGIEARYGDVRRVEVQDITIDRNQAVTTSTIKVVREDGTETVERRRLTFTWGGDPKITDDTTTG
jgi:hypothetical protein